MQDLTKKIRPEADKARLTAADHDRRGAGLLYVYPVVSRRAGGVSIGVNLNVNNACNWRCVYCQVPEQRVAPGARRLNDIALSGNGEPTSAGEFGQVVDLIGQVRREAGVPDAVKTVLITNGSLMHRASVQAGVAGLRALQGEVWFKIDRAPGAGMRKVNNSRAGLERVRANLQAAAGLCPTWVQTCMFAWDGAPPGESELLAYLDLLGERLAAGVRLEGVLLYSLARPSFQPEAGHLQALPAGWLESFAARIRMLGLEVRVTP